MYKVETHDNSKQYFSGLELETNAFYVTATSTLSNMMIELMHLGANDRWKLMDIESFTKLIYPKWSDILNKLKLKAEVRKILMELKKDSDEKLKKEIIFLEDNLSILVSDIGFLAEAGTGELNLKGGFSTKEVFKLVYNKLIKTNIYKELTQEILNVPFIQALIKGLGNVKGEKLQRIYFYNINYLDLRRYLVVELLRLAGFEVVFRIPYFNGLKVINKCWDMVYKNEAVFQWTNNSSSFEHMLKASRYIAFLEGTNTIEDYKEEVFTKTYREVSDFRKDMKGNRIVTLYKDSLKSCIDYKVTSDRHCFESSIGRFLSKLYECRVNYNTVLLDFNLFRELVTSGWVETKGFNGIRLSEYLAANEAYFEGIRTIDDVLYKIRKIKELEEVNEIFEEPIKGKIKKSNLKRFLSNPFRAFGYANLDKYNITANYFETVTIRLKNIITRALSEKEGLINIPSHLELLKLAFNNEYIKKIYKTGSELEKKITSKIWATLNNTGAFANSLHKEEIKELFNITLAFKSAKGGGRQEDTDFSIDQLEGILLRDRLVNYGDSKAIFISDLSYKSYETYMQAKIIAGKVLKNEDFYELFSENLVGMHKNIALGGISFQETSSKAVEAYLKFALGNLFINFQGRKEFSFIAGLREDDDKAIILKQIEALYDNEIEIKQELNFEDMALESEMSSTSVRTYDRKAFKGGFNNLPEVAYRDLDFCDNKFLYSSILEEHPMYYLEFQQKLALSGIVSMLKNSLEDSYENISKHIFPLFPQWLPVVKENILTCEYARKNIRDYKYFDGINYPKTMDVLYLLKSKYIVTENSKIRNRYNKGEFKVDKYYEEFLKDYFESESHNSGIHCKMCPHIYVCRKGEFAIDNK